MNKEYSAGVVTFREEKSAGSKRMYLILHYKRGHWDFPKGRIEEGETKKQAAIRELHEETGLTANIYPDFEQSLSYLFRNPTGELTSKEVTYFVGAVNSSEVILSDEHIYFRWVSLKDAIKELTYTNARQLLGMVDHYLDAQALRAE